MKERFIFWFFFCASLLACQAESPNYEQDPSSSEQDGKENVTPIETPAEDDQSCMEFCLGRGHTYDHCQNTCEGNEPDNNGQNPPSVECIPVSEVCNGIDDDCDGEIDEENSRGCQPFYLDNDGDGEGSVESRCLCAPEWNYSADNSDDCDDNNASANHSNTQDLCDISYPIDNDCDGLLDEDVGANECPYAEDALGGAQVTPDELWYPSDVTNAAETTYQGHKRGAVDIVLLMGTNVSSMKDCRVTYVENSCPDNYGAAPPHTCASTCGNYFGNHIKAECFDGTRFLIGHLKQGTVEPEVGDIICAGQFIAESGSSGCVMSGVGGTGAHIHVEYCEPNQSGGCEYVNMPVQMDTLFADRDTKKGGNAFLGERCDALNSLNAAGFLSKDCEGYRQESTCDVDRAVLAKVLGDSIGVSELSSFGECEAQCTDMNQGEWYYSWIEIMNRLAFDDGIVPYNVDILCKPGDVMIRLHALKVIIEVYNFDKLRPGRSWDFDTEGIPSALLTYVYTAVELGLIDSDKPLHPGRPITIGWIAQVIDRARNVHNFIVQENDVLSCGGAILPPDPPECECSPGEFRNCEGDGQEFCADDCHWSDICEHDLENCVAESTSQHCGVCGVQFQTCENGVRSPWSECEEGLRGSCSPGESRGCEFGGTEYCGPDCEWTGECLDQGCEGERVIPCGDRCGVKVRTCDPVTGLWNDPPCVNEGLCSAGDERGCGNNGTEYCSDDCAWSGECLGQGCSGSPTEICGNCGIKTRTCNNGTWSDWGACLSQGECSPDSTQECGNGGSKTCSAECTWNDCLGQNCIGDPEGSCGNCGTKTRTCNNGSWSDWSSCFGEGECSPGDSQECGIGGTEVCSNQCTWQDCEGGGECLAGSVTLRQDCEELYDNYQNNMECSGLQRVMECNDNSQFEETVSCPQYLVDGDISCMRVPDDAYGLSFCLTAEQSADGTITLRIEKSGVRDTRFSDNTIGIDVYDRGLGDFVAGRGCTGQYAGDDHIDFTLGSGSNLSFDWNGVARIQVYLTSPCGNGQNEAVYVTGAVRVYRCYN